MISTNKKENLGFTLVEILVVASIAVIMAVALTSFQRNLVIWNTFFANSLTGQDEVRRAFKTMTAELRSMAPASTGAYPLVVAATSSVTFYADVDNDGLYERIRYYTSGTTLKRGSIKPTGNPLGYTGAETTSELIHSLANGTSSIFSYYNSSYEGTTAPLAAPVDISAVRLVKIDAAVDVDSRRAPVPLLFTTQVSLRNLKDNL